MEVDEHNSSTYFPLQNIFALHLMRFLGPLVKLEVAAFALPPILVEGIDTIDFHGLPLWKIILVRSFLNRLLLLLRLSSYRFEVHRHYRLSSCTKVSYTEKGDVIIATIAVSVYRFCLASLTPAFDSRYASNRTLS